MLNLIKKSDVIKFNDVSSQLGLSIGEARSFLYALIHKGFVKADLSHDDLTNNPTLWAAYDGF